MLLWKPAPSSLSATVLTRHGWEALLSLGSFSTTFRVLPHGLVGLGFVEGADCPHWSQELTLGRTDAYCFD